MPHLQAARPAALLDRPFTREGVFVFLAVNGLRLAASNPAFEKLVRSVAAGALDKSAVTSFLRRCCRT